MTPARATPDDFIVVTPGGFQLGYKVGDPGYGGGGSISEGEIETYNEPLQVGDVVQFMCCDRLDDVEVTFRRDGTHVVHGEVPKEHNWCRLIGDQETMQGSFDDLAKAVTGQKVDGLIDIDLFHGSEETEQRISVQFARWSDRLPHKFIINDGKPAFEQVSAASVNN